MDIIEGYKQKARESLNNVLNSLSQADDEETTAEQLPSNSKLIQEIQTPPPDTDTYETEQFEYFSKITTKKQPKCVVCHKVAPKYSCPKCKVRYCSSEHYKTHNLFCTERFFKGQVEALLKRTKAAEGERRKMVEMLKVHGEEQAESETQLMQESKVEEVGVQRLQEILEALEEGREVVLSANEEACFERYVKTIEDCSAQDGLKVETVEESNEQQQELFEEYVPFWMVEEGLDQYFLIDQPIPIEIFNQSSNKTLLQYRQQTAPSLRAYLNSLSTTIFFKKTSIFIVYDLVQVSYLTVLLFRSYNGEYLSNPQFSISFLRLYQEDLARGVAQSQPTTVAQLALSDLPTVMPLLKIQLQKEGEGDLLEILKGWLPFVSHDSEKIFKSKFVCLEALYRLIEALKGKGEQKIKLSSKEARLIKKMEFLLNFVNSILYVQAEDHPQLPPAFIQTNCLSLLQKIIAKDKQIELANAASIKTMKDEQSRQQQLRIQKILIP